MLLFPATETSDDREFTVYKKERCNPPVRKTERNTFIIQSITSIIIGRQFTVPALRCPDELVGSCLNSYKRRCIPSSSCGVNGTLGPGPVPRLGSQLGEPAFTGPLMASGGLRITGMVAALSCTIIRAVRLLNSLQRFQL
jgi:hypothetical protein